MLAVARAIAFFALNGSDVSRELGAIHGRLGEGLQNLRAWMGR